MADYGYQTTANAYDKSAGYEVKQDRNPDAFYNIAEQANSRMGDFLLSLSALTDQLCGGQPPSAEETGTSIRGVPSGHFANATDQCGQIMMKLEQANRLIERISGQL